VGSNCASHANASYAFAPSPLCGMLSSGGDTASAVNSDALGTAFMQQRTGHCKPSAGTKGDIHCRLVAITYSFLVQRFFDSSIFGQSVSSGSRRRER